MGNKKTKDLMFFLTVVFLGFLGIHKFIQKKTTLGWVYLFTYGLFGIGWIIDIIIEAKKLIPSETPKQIKYKTVPLNNEIHIEHKVSYKKLSLDNIVDQNINEFIVFDTETTGLSPSDGHSIIEFCLLKYKDNVLVDKLTSLVNPNCSLSPEITELTGITNQDLVGKPHMREFVNQIIEFINNQIIIGHNVNFDLKFLKAEIERCKFPTAELQIEYLDTLDIAKKTIYDIDNYKLMTLKEYCGIQTTSHRAYADCETTYEVYKYCFDLLKENNAREKKMHDNYLKRQQECLAKLSGDEQEIINHFLETANNHGKEIEYNFKSDKAISFTLCGIEIGRIKFNGRKHYCKLFAGDFKAHEWEYVENTEKAKILEYIDDLFIYVDKEYKRYFLEYGD
jgi:DNA polymerase III epsilon subunit family exonuclease